MLEWKEPPNRLGPGPKSSTKDFENVGNELKGNPGQWALIDVGEKHYRAENWRTGLRRLFGYNIEVAGQKVGSDRVEVYARWIGKP